MKPGETREMAVVFYVDPKLAENSEQDGLNAHHAVLHLLSGASSRRARAVDAGKDQAVAGARRREIRPHLS